MGVSNIPQKLSFEVLAVVTIRDTILRNLMPCSVTGYRCFEGMYCLYYQVQKVSPTSNRWQAVIQAVCLSEMIVNFHQTT
jgi:hypothetical protein